MTEFPDTQSVLLTQIQTLENREAWEQFVALYRPVIYRMARRKSFQEAGSELVATGFLMSVTNARLRETFFLSEFQTGAWKLEYQPQCQFGSCSVW